MQGPLCTEWLLFFLVSKSQAQFYKDYKIKFWTNLMREKRDHSQKIPAKKPFIINGATVLVWEQSLFNFVP